MQGVLYVSSSEPFENPSAGTYDFQEYLDFINIDLLLLTAGHRHGAVKSFQEQVSTVWKFLHEEYFFETTPKVGAYEGEKPRLCLVMCPL